MLAALSDDDTIMMMMIGKLSVTNGFSEMGFSQGVPETSAFFLLLMIIMFVK